MVDEPKDVRLPIMVTRSEAHAIDDWRFTNRVNTRAEAIRQLISIGLDAAREDPQPEPEQPLARPWTIPTRIHQLASAAGAGDRPDSWTGWETMIGAWLERQQITSIDFETLRSGALPDVPIEDKGADVALTKTMQSLGWRAITKRSQRGKPEVIFYAPE